MSKTVVVWDKRYLKYETGLWHPERPERLLAIQKVLDERPIGRPKRSVAEGLFWPWREDTVWRLLPSRLKDVLKPS